MGGVSDPSSGYSCKSALEARGERGELLGYNCGNVWTVVLVAGQGRHAFETVGNGCVWKNLLSLKVVHVAGGRGLDGPGHLDSQLGR